MPISIIESWYQRDGYVKSMADLIEKELAAFSNPEEVCSFTIPTAPVFIQILQMMEADCLFHIIILNFVTAICIAVKFLCYRDFCFSYNLALLYIPFPR